MNKFKWQQNDKTAIISGGYLSLTVKNTYGKHYTASIDALGLAREIDFWAGSIEQAKDFATEQALKLFQELAEDADKIRMATIAG